MTCSFQRYDYSIKTIRSLIRSLSPVNLKWRVQREAYRALSSRSLRSNNLNFRSASLLLQKHSTWSLSFAVNRSRNKPIARLFSGLGRYMHLSFWSVWTEPLTATVFHLVESVPAQRAMILQRSCEKNYKSCLHSLLYRRYK